MSFIHGLSQTVRGRARAKKLPFGRSSPISSLDAIRVSSSATLTVFVFLDAPPAPEIDLRECFLVGEAVESGLHLRLLSLVLKLFKRLDGFKVFPCCINRLLHGLVAIRKRDDCELLREISVARRADQQSVRLSARFFCEWPSQGRYPSQCPRARS